MRCSVHLERVRQAPEILLKLHGNRGMGHDWGLSASNPLKAKGAWGAFQRVYPPPNQAISQPRTATRRSYGLRPARTARVRALIGRPTLDISSISPPRSIAGSSEPRKATADIIRIEGWSRRTAGESFEARASGARTERRRPRHLAATVGLQGPALHRGREGATGTWLRLARHHSRARRRQGFIYTTTAAWQR